MRLNVMDLPVAAGADITKLLMEEKHGRFWQLIYVPEPPGGVWCLTGGTRTSQCLGVWKEPEHTDRDSFCREGGILTALEELGNGGTEA